MSLLSIAGAAIDARVLAGMKDAGFASIRPSHGYVIQRLVTGPQSITGMAADLGVTQQAMSKMVKEMIRLGIAAQHIDAADSRRRPITLTDHGRAGVESARAVRIELESNLRKAVGSEDFAATQRVLDVLLDQLGLRREVTDRKVPMPPDA